MCSEVKVNSGPRLYIVQNDVYHYLTGHLSNGNQVLMMGDGSDNGTPSFPRVEFDAEGDVIAVYREEPAELSAASAAFIPGTIRVKSFFIPDIWFGIQDLSDHYQKFLDCPEEADADQKLYYPKEIQDWRGRKSFMLWCNEDYYLSEDGELESS